MRKFALITVGLLLAVCWASVASAELTLWLKYHYAAEDAYERGEYNRAEQLFKAAERESIITLPESNFRRAATLDGLGLVYTAQGRLASSRYRHTSDSTHADTPAHSPSRERPLGTPQPCLQLTCCSTCRQPQPTIQCCTLQTSKR